MIDKLYNLKKTQTDQKLMQKGQIMSKVNQIDSEIMLTEQKIITTSVQKHGAISDFAVLEIHKNTMKQHIKDLQYQKSNFIKQLEVIEEEIIELQKQSEQFKYILEEEKKERIKAALKEEQDLAEEFIQSKYIAG